MSVVGNPVFRISDQILEGTLKPADCFEPTLPPYEIRPTEISLKIYLLGHLMKHFRNFALLSGLSFLTFHF